MNNFFSRGSAITRLSCKKRCCQRMREDRGLTLIELLAGIAITGLLLSVLYALYTTAWENWSVNQRSNEMQQYMRFAMKTIVEDIQSSEQAALTSDSLGIEITLTNGDEIEYRIVDEELRRYIDKPPLKSGWDTANPLGGPFGSISINPDESISRLYHVTVVTKEVRVGLRGKVGSMTLTTEVYAPNTK